ncbi:MAG: TIGR01777 family oxidoreductase [Desulfobaccales bacterium]
MKVFMTGGTGFVGAYLSRELVKLGHEVTILSRREQPFAVQRPGIRLVLGDPAQEGDWMGAAPEHDWIINLAGASIFSRWSPAYKQEIVESRIRATRNLVIALAGGNRRQLFCSTSAVGYYGPHGDEALTEESPPGSDFLARLGVDWEAEALKARELGLRVVITRFGIVLGKGGGALGQMVPMFRRFLGGPMGSGQQWFSWIHQVDLARAFSFIGEHPEIDGPVNFTTPNPVRNRELAQALGRALRRPAWLRTPAFMIRLAMGELGDTLLSGQRVIPKRLIEAGFKFDFPAIEPALKDLLA